MDLETLERCRADREKLGRDLFLGFDPKVAKELQDLCRLVRAQIAGSPKFGDVIEPLGRIIEAAALFERRWRNLNHELAKYELKNALQWLASV